MIDVGTLVGRLTLEDSATSALKGFQSNLTAIGSTLTTAGSTLTLGITAPLVAAAGASLLFAGNFEMSMTRLVSLAGVSQDELEGVEQHILDLAPAVGIGPQALADAMMKVSSTVSDTGKALSILDMSAKLSAAGMGTALDVAGALTAVINSYAASGLTAARAADILTKAVQLGGAEAKELAPTLANVVPIAAQMGVSFEEVAANIATLTKLGVPASEAVTQLSSVMSALLKETKQGGEALASVNMSYAGLRAEVKDKGLAATLLHLSTVFKGNETGLTDVFGRIEALRNVMGTAGVQADTYAEVLTDVKNASDGVGAATSAYNAVQGKQIQTWGQVSAAVQVAAIRFGDALAPAMGSVLKIALPLLDKLGALAKWFSELPQPVQRVAIGLGALAAAAGPVLYIVGSLATAWAALLPLVPAVGAALAIATGPIGLVALAITGLVTAVAIFRGHMDELKKDSNIGQPLTGLKDAAGNAIVPIKDVDAAMAKLGGATSTGVYNGMTLTIGSLKSTEAAIKPVVFQTDAQAEAAEKAAAKQKKFREELAENTAAAFKIDSTLFGLTNTIGHLDTTELDNIKTMLAATEASKVLMEKISDIERVAWEANFGFKGMADGLENLGEKSTELDQLNKYLAVVKDRANDFDESLDDLAKTFAQLAQVSDGAMGNILKGVGTVIVTLKLAKEAGKNFADALSNIKAGNTAQGYTQLAGSVGVAVGMLDSATASGSTAERALKGAAAGAAVGTVIFPVLGTAIGAGVGALVGWYRGAKAAREEMEKLRESQFDFEKQIWKTLTAQQALEAGGVQWKATTIAVRDAYLLTGRTAEEAYADVKAMWDSTEQGADANAAAIDKVNVAFTQLRLRAEAVDKATSSLLTTIDTVGVGLPEAFRPMLERLLDLPGITESAKAALTGLLDNATPNFAKLQAMAKGYGGEISMLGPTFQQAHVTANARQWISDFEALKEAGADMNGVLGFMADEASAVVQESLKFGSEIPENMRPMIQSLIDSKLLFGESKNLITDISTLKFGAAVKTDVELLKDSILLLAEAIEKIPGKLAAISNTRVDPIHVRIQYDDPGYSSNDDPQNYATGGVVYAATGAIIPFIPRGTDTVPAMLTPGEGVVTTRGMSRIGPSGLDQINNGVQDTYDDDVYQEIAGMRRDIGRLLKDQPRALRIALEDALLLLPKRAA